MTRRHLAAAIACLALLATGCDDPGDEDSGITPSEAESLLDDMTQEPTTPAATRTPTPEPTAIPTPTPTPSPSATQAAEWVAPDPITADYVTRVLNELYRLENPIDVQLAANASAGDPPGELEALTEAFRVTHTEESAGVTASLVLSLDPSYFAEVYRNPPGAATATNVEVLESNQSCISAMLDEDLSAVLVESSVEPVTVRLVTGGTRPNVTGWLIGARGGGPSTECPA